MRVRCSLLVTALWYVRLREFFLRYIHVGSVLFFFYIVIKLITWVHFNAFRAHLNIYSDLWCRKAIRRRYPLFIFHLHIKLLGNFIQTFDCGRRYDSSIRDLAQVHWCKINVIIELSDLLHQMFRIILLWQNSCLPISVTCHFLQVSQDCLLWLVEHFLSSFGLSLTT